MRLQNSVVLLMALSAGMALAHLRGHERRHQHQQRNPQVKERGDMVTAVIDGKTDTWENNYSGGAQTPTPASSTPASSTPASAPTTPPSTCGGTGFGQRTPSSGSGDTYKGNVGSPYGCNIIEISEGDLNNYQYVVQVNGCSGQPYTIVVWNTYGPDGKMDGSFGNAIHTITIGAGEVKYLAMDEDTQGGLCGAPGGSVPKNSFGQYAATWLEFGFGDCSNGNWSGFDVSVITAQNAGLPVQGMKACQKGTSTCSTVTEGASQVTNAYTKNQTDIGGIGGNIAPGPLFIEVTLCYS
jgi:hypothetical protein